MVTGLCQEVINFDRWNESSVLDQDLELRQGRVDLLALLAFLPSVISSFFTQNKWDSPLPPRPSPRSTTGFSGCCCCEEVAIVEKLYKVTILERGSF